jgi:predicted nucleotidyltransferase
VTTIKSHTCAINRYNGAVDYVTPIEAVVPGVQGRVLGVLARSDTELTMRSVAQLAGVSVNRAVSVLNHLVALGIVERREAGSAALVRLARDNEAARVVTSLRDLSSRVIDRLRSQSKTIRPAPASLVLFGSFVRDEARAASDLDVLAVRARHVSEDDPKWLEGLGQWVARATRIVGNPVSLLTVGQEELPGLLRRKQSVWREIAQDGLVLLGSELPDLTRTAS